MESLNKKIYLLIGFLLVILIPFSNIANAACPYYPIPDEQINPTISITGVSVTDGIVSIRVSFTAGTRIWYDMDGNITTICDGYIHEIDLWVYTSDGTRFAYVNAPINQVYSGSDTLQWISPSFAQDTYTLEVRAWDGGLETRLGCTISAPDTATVFIDNPLPRITSPADGSTVQGVGRYGVVDVTCEFFSPIGIRGLRLDVYDGMYPYGRRVFVTGQAYSEPYPTSGTCTFQWQSGGSPQGDCNLIVKANDCSGGLGRWGWSDLVTVILVKGPPTASFTYSPENPLIYDEVTFDASSSYDDGWIVKYEWDFGDGVSVGSAEVQVVKHAYTQAGDYTVTLTVTDNDGMTGSVGRPVSVREAEQMIKPVEGYLYSGYGPRSGGFHYGIDIVGLTPQVINGADIRAPADGWVDDFGFVADKDGYWLRIRHPKILKRDGTVVSNIYSYYCHLLKQPDLQKDASVKQGEVIAQVGNTGNSKAPHLHYGVKEGGIFVDPLGYLYYSPRPRKGFKIEARCPIDITVIDPEGYLVSKNSIEIEETVTYLEEDFDGDGDLDDRIWFYDRKIGNYTITVVPQPDALPDDTYSLEVTADNETIILAENVPISDIPDEPYVIEWTETGINVAPIANAGDDQTVYATVAGIAQVALDGSGSSDPDGDDLTYSWYLDGQKIATGVSPTIQLPAGVYVIDLVVSDGTADSQPDQVRVIVIQTVGVDIKPGSWPNTINLGSNGVIPVAILTTESFDATSVDPSTVQLEGLGVAVRGKSEKLLANEEDVDEDGDIDLVVKIETENLEPGAWQSGLVVLTGETYDGKAIEGCDEIIIVPPE